MDCNKLSDYISATDELLNVNLDNLRKQIKEEGTDIAPYFLEIGRFFFEHSGHRIVIVNQYNEMFIRGCFR